MNNQKFFTTSDVVSSNRVLYTASPFARSSLLYLQEVGTLRALKPHTSRRTNLSSFLFFTVISGAGSLSYEGESYSLSTGDMVFINCEKPYSHTTETDLWSLRWCHFNGPTMPAVYDKYKDRGGRAVFHPESPDSFTTILDSLYSLASGSDYIKDMRINEGLNSLLTLIMEQSWHPEEKGNKPLKEGSVPQIKAFIDQNYNTTITLDSLSSQFFINKYYMSRSFKDQIGMTIGEYLNSVRITHAKQLLRFSSLTIAEIAAGVGVGDPSYFSRLFKRIEGVSPDQYRKQW